MPANLLECGCFPTYRCNISINDRNAQFLLAQNEIIAVTRFAFILPGKEIVRLNLFIRNAVEPQKVMRAGTVFARKLFLEMCKLSCDRQMYTLIFLISKYFLD